MKKESLLLLLLVAVQSLTAQQSEFSVSGEYRQDAESTILIISDEAGMELNRQSFVNPYSPLRDLTLPNPSPSEVYWLTIVTVFRSSDVAGAIPIANALTFYRPPADQLIPYDEKIREGVDFHLAYQAANDRTVFELNGVTSVDEIWCPTLNESAYGKQLFRRREVLKFWIRNPQQRNHLVYLRCNGEEEFRELFIPFKEIENLQEIEWDNLPINDQWVHLDFSENPAIYHWVLSVSADGFSPFFRMVQSENRSIEWMYSSNQGEYRSYVIKELGVPVLFPISLPEPSFKLRLYQTDEESRTSYSWELNELDIDFFDIQPIEIPTIGSFRIVEGQFEIETPMGVEAWRMKLPHSGLNPILYNDQSQFIPVHWVIGSRSDEKILFYPPDIREFIPSPRFEAGQYSQVLHPSFQMDYRTNNQEVRVFYRLETE